MKDINDYLKTECRYYPTRGRAKRDNKFKY